MTVGKEYNDIYVSIDNSPEEENAIYLKKEDVVGKEVGHTWNASRLPNVSFIKIVEIKDSGNIVLIKDFSEYEQVHGVLDIVGGREQYELNTATGKFTEVELEQKYKTQTIDISYELSSSITPKDIDEASVGHTWTNKRVSLYNGKDGTSLISINAHLVEKDSTGKSTIIISETWHDSRLDNGKGDTYIEPTREFSYNPLNKDNLFEELELSNKYKDPKSLPTSPVTEAGQAKEVFPTHIAKN